MCFYSRHGKYTVISLISETKKIKFVLFEIKPLQQAPDCNQNLHPLIFTTQIWGFEDFATTHARATPILPRNSDLEIA